jgi:catechol 2,3-dioxygenase-like lactoylglutathione lyase family enzyme
MEPTNDPPVAPPLGIAAVLLFTRDPAALAAFYRRHFGVPLRPVNVPGLAPHWACDVGRVYLSLWPSDGPEAPGPSDGAGGVAFQVRDVAGDYRRLVAAGVASLFPPRRTAVGLVARLADPDGNPVEIIQVLAPGTG